MSYDYLLFKLDGTPTVAELSKENTLPLGSLEAVQRAISACYPAVVWKGRDGALDGRGFSVEDADPIRCVSFRTSLRAESRRALATLCAATGWTAFDMQTATFLELP